MTTPEFLRLLEIIRDQFDWTLTADTGDDSEPRIRPRPHLRGTPSGKPTTILCPLRALCYVRTGRVIADGAWPDAAAVLDIDLEEAQALDAASNDQTWNGAEGQRAPVKHLMGIRRGLLEATGLTEDQRRCFWNTPISQCPTNRLRGP